MGKGNSVTGNNHKYYSSVQCFVWINVSYWSGQLSASVIYLYPFYSPQLQLSRCCDVPRSNAVMLLYESVLTAGERIWDGWSGIVCVCAITAPARR